MHIVHLQFTPTHNITYIYRASLSHSFYPMFNHIFPTEKHNYYIPPPPATNNPKTKTKPKLAQKWTFSPIFFLFILHFVFILLLRSSFEIFFERSSLEIFLSNHCHSSQDPFPYRVDTFQSRQYNIRRSTKRRRIHRAVVHVVLFITVTKHEFQKKHPSKKRTTSAQRATNRKQKKINTFFHPNVLFWGTKRPNLIKNKSGEKQLKMTK